MEIGLGILGIGWEKNVKLNHSSISTTFMENKDSHITKHLINKSLISFTIKFSSFLILRIN